MPKNIIIAGGSSGIGLALIEILLRTDQRVINLDVNPAPVLPTELFHEEIIDLKNAAMVCQCIDSIGNKYGKINGLACIAGIGYITTLHDLTIEDFDQQVKGNLHVSFYLIKSVIPFLAPDASIVTVSSVSSYGGPGASAAYGAAKAGIIGLTKNIAFELARQKVRVNCVIPGATHTALFQRLSTPMERRMLEQFTPRKELGKPEDVANLIDFLLSENSTHIVGQIIAVDGGLSIGYRPALY